MLIGVGGTVSDRRISPLAANDKNAMDAFVVLFYFNTKESAMSGEDLLHTVVVNHEQQYSIWPSFKALPDGWKDAGFQGPKADCLAHIETVWTDMRPLSLRQALERTD